jgi:hypothetical protein
LSKYDFSAPRSLIDAKLWASRAGATTEVPIMRPIVKNLRFSPDYLPVAPGATLSPLSHKNVTDGR